ncbi:MAG TPA: hypothetical protein DIT97_07400 [Gimesia maris]|uniref:Uncharacterized protein n=1 Tax=Gimesia maris TaxID=122 RepID=A0A3D3R251_9PLAN|nr:hypothetical protein [Gimesia maris]
MSERAEQVSEDRPCNGTLQPRPPARGAQPGLQPGSPTVLFSCHFVFFVVDTFQFDGSIGSHDGVKLVCTSSGGRT